MENSTNSSFGTGFLVLVCIVNAYLLFGLSDEKQPAETENQPNYSSGEEARVEMDHEPYYIDLD